MNKLVNRKLNYLSLIKKKQSARILGEILSLFARSTERAVLEQFHPRESYSYRQSFLRILLKERAAPEQSRCENLTAMAKYLRGQVLGVFH